ncbi:MAG: tetratricopeptide repeat protein [Spirochaetes bacterium]|nr:tetratricopeptide repeat protein [Spirochaetota bacterium]
MAVTEEIQNLAPEEEAEIKRIVDSFDSELSSIAQMRGKVSVIQADSTADDFTITPGEKSETGELEAVPEVYEEPEEIVDITDMIQEVPEEAPPSGKEEALPEFEFEEPATFEEAPKETEIAVEEQLPKELLEEEIPAFEEKEIPPRPSKKEVSPLDELEELTKFEPETVEAHEIRTDEFVTEEPRGPRDVSLDEDIHLSEIGAEEVSEISEIKAEELPQADLSALGIDEEMPQPAAFEEISKEEEPPRARFETPSFDELESFEEPVRKAEKVERAVEEFRPEFEGLGEEETQPISMEESVEISDAELRRLKKALLLLHPTLRRKIKDIILQDQLSPEDTRKLIDLIVSGKPEDNIQRFIEKKLNIRLTLEEEIPQRRVITARPEYTREGMQRQQRLLRQTKIIAAAILVGFVLTVTVYQYIYKPFMAKRLINKGVALILEPGDPATKKVKDYKKAEELFEYVDQHYKKDYLYGYNAYARAYFKKREFDYSYTKLKRAFQINNRDIDTLNNTGYFFAKIPQNYYTRIQNDAIKTFAPKGTYEISQVDLAIMMYNRALAIDPKNITALFGIGNAYLYQGQYLKSRQYFENILKVDPNSWVGYAGLLNLFIERDNLPEVLSIHTDLRARDILTDIPSPLLAKLAHYYLGKNRSDTFNVRVDLGIQSPRLKDEEDNLIPACRGVLDALKEKDPDYPPLYVASAKLAAAQKNLKLVEMLLKEAEQKAEEKGERYFAALHLLGEYNYTIKQPVEAYKYLNAAITAYQYPPEFTYEDFYYESESIGKTYAYLGHIFYYFFDKVTLRFGDELDEALLDEESDKMANLDIARQKYELALQENFSSPEVRYNLGRIYYVNQNYQQALEQWLNLYEDIVTNPQVMFAIGNAFYHMNNLEASKGEYLKMIAVFERKAEAIRMPRADRQEHLIIFQSLASAYNNLGAVYQIQGNETKSSIAYWKAIEYASRLGMENEFARVNLARGFKPRTQPIMPILDENIPYSIDIFRAELR